MGEEATKFEQPEEDRERQRDPPDDDPRHEPEEVGLHLNNGEAIFYSRPIPTLRAIEQVNIL